MKELKVDGSEGEKRELKGGAKKEGKVREKGAEGGWI